MASRRVGRPLQVGLILTLAIALGALAGWASAGAQDGEAAGDVTLLRGGNLIAYTGATLPVEEALNNVAPVVSRVWHWDAAGQVWEAWDRVLPAILQGFTQLETGQAYFIYADSDVPWSWIPAAGGAASALVVAVQPGSGPSGTSATLTVTGARAGDRVTVFVGATSAAGTADADGSYATQATLTGDVSQSVVVTAIAGISGSARTGQGTFLVTGSAASQTAGALVVTLDPASGASGTEALVVVTGVSSNGAVTLIIGASAERLAADANGTLVVRREMTGSSGQRVAVSAVSSVGNVDRAGSAQFSVTGGAAAEGTNGTASLGVTLETALGPSGTVSGIVVTGAEAGATITLVIGTRVRFGTADANGTLVVTETFTGTAGTSVGITAVTGTPGAERSGSASFTLAADASGAGGLSVSVSPLAGPSGALSTITVSNAVPGALTSVSVGGQTYTGTADAAGRLQVALPLTGAAGQSLAIAASSTAGGVTRTGTTVFSVTSGRLTVNVAPASGASGSAAQVIVTNAGAGASVRITLSTGQTYTETADATGTARAVAAFTGTAGTSVIVTASVALVGAIEAASTTYAITGS